MSEQGRSGLSSKVNERILDRIAGLEKIIAPELVKQALATTGKQVTRECKLNNEVRTWVVLSMGLFTELPIRQVFKACRRLRRGERSPARSRLCVARQRLGSEPLAALHKLVVRPLATPHTPGAFYRGMRKVRIDGTVLDVPDCDGQRTDTAPLQNLRSLPESGGIEDADSRRVSETGSFRNSRHGVSEQSRRNHSWGLARVQS